MAAPSRSQLRAGAKHVDYEIDMFMWTAFYLKNPRKHRETHKAVIRRAILEAWAIHLRSLIEFFHAKRTDVLRAEHFMVDEDAWSRALPKLNKQEGRRQKALHQLLAHIAIGRNARKSNWSERDHLIVSRRVALFLTHLPLQRRLWFPDASQWFASAASIPRQK